jgi:hypothetical protein
MSRVPITLQAFVRRIVSIDQNAMKKNNCRGVGQLIQGRAAENNSPQACTRDSFGNGAEWTINPAACPLIWVRDLFGVRIGEAFGWAKMG